MTITFLYLIFEEIYFNSSNIFVSISSLQEIEICKDRNFYKKSISHFTSFEKIQRFRCGENFYSQLLSILQKFHIDNFYVLNIIIYLSIQILTTYVNTTQVDFVNAIVYNSLTGVQSYQYAYFVRNNIAGNDMNDEFNNLTVNDPCMSNPCLNGGSCSIGFGNNYACYCQFSFTGIKLRFKLFIFS